MADRSGDTGILFNIDSQAPNKVVKEWLETQKVFVDNEWKECYDNELGKTNHRR